MPNSVPASTPLTPSGQNEIEQKGVDMSAGTLQTGPDTPTTADNDVSEKPQPKSASGHMREGDTIFIDREGQLNSKDAKITKDTTLKV
jgi:hypothetical protein